VQHVHESQPTRSLGALVNELVQTSPGVYREVLRELNGRP
jgi:hypothetical protein